MTQDGELEIVLPAKISEETVEGLKAGKAGASSYPVAPYLHFMAEQRPYVTLCLKKVVK